MGSQGFRNIAGNPFVYQEDTRSAAFGLDAAAQTWKLSVKATTGALPTDTAQLVIDPATNGNVTIDPNGSGNLVVTSGNVSLTAGNLALPATSSTVGQVTLATYPMLHFYNSVWGSGINSHCNIFIGYASGSTYLAGGSAGSNIANVAIGQNTLYSMTDSSTGANVAVGASALRALTTGNSNTAFGLATGFGLVSGSYNTLCGAYIGAISNYTAGAYTGSESSNIIIQNVGVAGESNKIRIGTSGSGDGQQNACYVAGIYGVTPGGTVNAALVDSNGQLGSVASLGVANGGTGAATLTDHGILLGSGTGAITPLGEASNGQLPIGSTGADPVLATLTASTGITVANGAGTITLSSTTTTCNTQIDSYTLVIGDAGKLIIMNKATANTLTVPKNSSVAFATGTIIAVSQYGAGVTTIAPVDGDVTLRAPGSLLNLYTQYSSATLVKIGTDEWIVSGDLS
jgi:hypothetical protein